jgi:cation diffusion facilitator family transporter
MDLKQDIRLQRRVLVVGFLLMGLKLAAWLITGANALFSDMAESFVNIFAGAFALYSLQLAATPKDFNHPYGHGKVEFISGAIEGVLIGIAGLGIFAKAIYDTVFPHEVTDLPIGIALGALAGLVNFVMGNQLVKRGKAAHSMTMISGGEHLKSDGYTSAAMLLGIAMVWATGWVWLDNVVAMAFAIFITLTGGKIVRKSVSGIMDETDAKLIEKLAVYLQGHRQPQWMDVHNLRIIKYGRALHVDCHLTLPRYYDLQQVHNEVEHLEQLIKNYFENPTEVFVHADPCVSALCATCALQDCPIRQTPFRQSFTWTPVNLVANSKHVEG